MTLAELIAAITPLELKDSAEYDSWLEALPLAETETGHKFYGNSDAVDSETTRDTALIGTKIGIPELDEVNEEGVAFGTRPVRTKIPSHIAHEAQHMIDKVGRGKETISRMNADYERKAVGKSYTTHHSEQRAFARELLLRMRMRYDRDGEVIPFTDYVKKQLREDSAIGKQVAKYLYKFMDDDLGVRVGINDLPSDHLLKAVMQKYW